MSHEKNLLQMIKTLPTLHLLEFYFRNLTLSDFTETAMKAELMSRMVAQDLAEGRV